jgi:hypothetical protein
MRRSGAGRILVVVLGTVLVAQAVRTAAAGQREDPVTTRAGAVLAVFTVTNDTLQVVPHSTEWQDVPGASAIVKVASSWGTGLILAHFFSDAVVITSPSPASVRILVDGALADPAVPAVWNAEKQDQFFIDRSLLVGPGTHVVQVQALTSEGGADLQLLDWGLTVQVARGR